jgi:iron complex transport system ATP-binding protein
VKHAVALRALSAGYPGRDVLKLVDLAVEGGERLAIVGPNGAGKSTLLRAMTGIIRPNAGEVVLDGTPISYLSREAIARRVGVVPQVATLPFAARVDDVVALGRVPHEDRLRGLRERDRAAVAAAIDMVGLGRLVDRDARSLSLGERQLVLLAVAIAQKAPIIILDEPTVHLDIRHQVDVMELLAELNERDGTTILAVMHDLRLAAHYFPRILVLADGRVVSDAPAADALSPEVVRDVFGVDPGLLAMPWGQAAPS